ncbi:DUF6929 family protein [Flavobacterium selenitireducens]|uniref:DUF6929 family protein n=1 Tax=Flavobacterium selenitireducens TaxID=2722704 RepID=UPI00168A7F29|nr:hypothetical protein [Flavobacterium selenitireducens]MBD3582529.1 hypothetical protein [Flavobacterium selenitireducens]
MKRFSLELLYHIVGIGSASGLFYRDGSVFIASDNAGCLYEFHADDASLAKIPLFDSDVLENIPKKIKPDFEALAERDGKLYLFGSGSTKNRTNVSIVDLSTKKVERRDLAGLYDKMRTASKIDADNFNLEGAIGVENAWFFFQRGNGNGGNNGVFKVIGSLESPDKIKYFPVALPKIKHVMTSFTDAILVGDAIWFLATAEDTQSTYDDGEVLGSIIGKIDYETMKIVYSEKITDRQKFEGLTFFSRSDSEIVFLLCEDNDTDGMESGIFKLTLSLD